MKISNFIPWANSRKKKKIVAAPLTVNRSLFYMEWTRAPILKSQGAENYWKSSFALPFQSLSGPLPTNAKQFRTTAPSPNHLYQMVPTADATTNGLITGKPIAQPLYIKEFGTQGRALFPINARPFEGSIGFNDIAPAGAV